MPLRLLWLAPALVLASACGGMFGSPIITRRVGGEERQGIFVSPFSYEHFVRGELAWLRGDLREALEEYQLARAGPEDDPLLVARIADVLDRLGREREALAMLDQGEALDPRSELVWLARGRIHERHDRATDAMDAYARAAALAPSSEEAPIAPRGAPPRARGARGGPTRFSSATSSARAARERPARGWPSRSSAAGAGRGRGGARPARGGAGALGRGARRRARGARRGAA
ncbi:MAG: tetratricopeptide repeat protein [Sandaracinaceae bacterium]|nr:tetratricopeptide repeat protein [Sandaracinaceae bacterium]